MVIYDLVCDSFHEFEGWFKNPEDMKMQKEDGLLACPICESLQISKKVTGSKVGRKSNSYSLASVTSATRQEMAFSSNGTSHGTRTDGMGEGDSPEKFAQLQKMLGEVHRYISNNFKDVGNRFAEEAISIHRGEKEAENICGTASPDQIKEMAVEGVEAVALPPKPIDKEKIN